jgi:aryl-alcohol dehydrogenase-like predicted oxidoreductase
MMSSSMPLRKLGTSSIDVSLICLGTMNWGEQNSEAEAFAQMDAALEMDINFFDTAEIYPVPLTASTVHLTETYIGRWLASRGKRESIVLASKVCGGVSSAGGTRHLAWLRDRDGMHRINRENILEALPASLERLQTSYLDLYQLHWPDRAVNIFGRRHYVANPDAPETAFEEVVMTMDELMKAGKIREWGLSNETPWGVMQWFHWCDKLGVKRPVSIQNAYSLLNRQYEVHLSEISHLEGIGLIPYATLGAGLLSGKYHNGTAGEEARINRYPTYWSRYKTPNAMAATEQYVALAQEFGMTPTQLAMAFVNQQAFVSSNIIGATSVKQLEELVSSTAITLSPELLARIDAIGEVYPAPCP